MFTPAHDAVVLYALEPPFPEETGNTPPELPSLSGVTPSLLGYTNLPQTARGLNNSKGFALGQQGAAYNKRGRVEPTASVEIRPGTLDALSHLVPTNGKLPYIALFVSVKGQGSDAGYTDVYRYCKPTTLDWKLGGGDKQGGEISVSAALWATAYQRMAYTEIPTAALRALGTPLMWHDVRQFSITDASGTEHSYRRALMNISAKIDYGLERKNERPNWGDNNPLSRTSYDILEHHITVSGEIGLHDRLPEDLFTAATNVNAQNWGDIVVSCYDLATTPKKFTLSLSGAFPSDETQGGGESSSEINHTVPFTADNFSLSF